MQDTSASIATVDPALHSTRAPVPNLLELAGWTVARVMAARPEAECRCE